MGGIGKTEDNLADAASGEQFEWTNMYGGYAQTARQEGLDKIAFLFDEVAKIEKTHEERFNRLLQNMKTGKVYGREEPEVWYCANCGHNHYGKEAPEVCPVCGHPRAYFQIKSTNY